MSKGFGFAIVEGGIGRDPEAKSTPGGVKVVNFSLGYERGFGDRVHTCWVNVVCFKDQAEFAEKHLKKGKTVRVTGEVDVRSWEEKDTGKKRYATEIIADKISFVDNRSDAPAAERPTRQERATPPVRTQVAPEPRATAPATDTDDPFRDEPF